jgi:DNA-binding XRE family transcriptional regulator
MSDTRPLENRGPATQADYEALLSELEDAQDRIALLEHRLAKAERRAPEMLTLDEADRLIAGKEHPIRFWREKRRMTQQALAGLAGISKAFLSEIEHGTKEPSIETLRKLANELKTDIDSLVPVELDKEKRRQALPWGVHRQRD